MNGSTQPSLQAAIQNHVIKTLGRKTNPQSGKDTIILYSSRLVSVLFKTYLLRALTLEFPFPHTPFHQNFQMEVLFS